MDEERLRRARISLEGLSVADAAGGFFEFNSRVAARALQTRLLPEVMWHYTDDTNMALSIFSILRQFGHIDQDALARDFANHFDRTRGYGLGARVMMNRIAAGEPWRAVAGALFNGQGSYGNGGAMRAAPIGAYFADDLSTAISSARLSAEVTHLHPEGVAGAVAVAVAAAFAWNQRHQPFDALAFLQAIIRETPASEVRDGLERALALPDDVHVEEAVNMLGNGSRVSAQDTVPLALWLAARNMTNYEEGIWQAIEAGGDVDTLCAIIGGVVACYTGLRGIPDTWIVQREPLPDWAFDEQVES
ncbi:MAG: ADP-ribosylglycohydrolase family protein [Anaerolineae bacterium]